VNRRAFLATLAAGLAGSALDPERLLWVPGKKTIVLPPVVRFVDYSDERFRLVILEAAKNLANEIDRRALADLTTGLATAVYPSLRDRGGDPSLRITTFHGLSRREASNVLAAVPSQARVLVENEGLTGWPVIDVIGPCAARL